MASYCATAMIPAYCEGYHGARVEQAVERRATHRALLSVHGV
jgi:hypothetical protein